MAKRAKDESLDLFYLSENKKNKRKNKTNKNTQSKKSNKTVKEQGTKDKKFDFDEEIVIGLKRIDPPAPTNSQKRAAKMAKQHKQKKRQQTAKGKIQSEELLIADIYSKQNRKKQETQKKSKKQPKKQAKKTQKKLTKEQERARKKRRIIFKFIKWTTLLLIIIGGSIYGLMSPIFNIINVQVVGNKKIDTEEIISLSGIEIGQNMFQYRKDIVINNIKENPYIESVKLHRKLPDTIELVVTERKATFILKVGNASAYINNQGYILEITNEKSTLPIIKGIKTELEQIQPGNRLITEDLEKLGDVLKIMESANSNNIADLITEIDITDRTNYILRMAKKKKTVYLGDVSNLSTKMLWIITLNEKEGNTEGDIILNVNLNSARPYFRKKV